MSELTKTLLNIRSLRAFSRELTLEQLEEALDKLSTVVAERKEAEEAELAAQAEQEAKLAEIAEKLLKTVLTLKLLLMRYQAKLRLKQNLSAHLALQNTSTRILTVKKNLDRPRSYTFCNPRAA